MSLRINNLLVSREILGYRPSNPDHDSPELIEKGLRKLIESGRVEVVPDSYRTEDRSGWINHTEIFLDRQEAVYLNREVQISTEKSHKGKVVLEMLMAVIPISRISADQVLEEYCEKMTKLFHPV